MSRFLIFAALLVAGTAQAQNTQDGSIYSRFGLGERQPFFQAKSLAMGGGGQALGAGPALTLENPASLSEQVLVRVVGGYQFLSLETENEAGLTSTLSSGGVAGFTVGFPILAGRLGVGLGLTPYTRVGYRVETARTLEAGGLPGDGTQYRSIFEGNGGLDRVSLGLGYRLHPRISVGVRGDFMFGILESVQRSQFANASLINSRVSESTRLSGFSAVLGIRASARQLLGEEDMLSFAATFTLPTRLSGERVLTSGEAVEPDTLGGTTSGSVDIPYSLGLGLAYHPTQNWTILMDFRYEPWTSFESDFSLPGVAPSSSDGLSDRIRVSGGVELFPGAGDLLAGFFARTSYRLGAFYERSYVSPDPSETIRNVGVTGGLALPTLIPGTRIDVNVEAGTRGSASGMLVRDRYLRVGVLLNFAERWFARRRLG